MVSRTSSLFVPPNFETAPSICSHVACRGVQKTVKTSPKPKQSQSKRNANKPNKPGAEHNTCTLFLCSCARVSIYRVPALLPPCPAPRNVQLVHRTRIPSAVRTYPEKDQRRKDASCCRQKQVSLMTTRRCNTLRRACVLESEGLQERWRDRIPPNGNRCALGNKDQSAAARRKRPAHRPRGGRLYASHAIRRDCALHFICLRQVPGYP